MASALEAVMIIMFGLSWPINLYKTIKSKNTKSKSILFIIFVAVGYICGILSKIISHNITWVFAFYLINLLMVSADIILYFIYKKRATKEV